MSSGHTWHWGTPERSYQIPLGKPGLVIPRCETLASRSVTFPLHQRESAALHPHHTSLLSRHEDLQLRVQREKDWTAKERELSKLPSNTTTAKFSLEKNIYQRLYPFLLELLPKCATLLLLHSWSSPTHLYNLVKILILYLCNINIQNSQHIAVFLFYQPCICEFI